MTYESKIQDYGKEHIYVVEVELDYCALTFGVAPCTATGSGDAKCFNTLNTCQDVPNYTGPITADTGVGYFNRILFGYTRSSGSFIDDGFAVDDRVTFVDGKNKLLTSRITAVAALQIDVSGLGFIKSATGDERLFAGGTTKTYRFCEPRSPHPIGINAIPSIKSINTTAAKIDIAGGMGERSNVSLTFRDHPHSDIDIDNYVDERTWIASDRGLFWTKLRARNPNYQFRALRVLSGYLHNGEFIADNFKTRNYVIDKMDVTAGTATITAKDPLKLASIKKAQVPKANSGRLIAALSAGTTSATLTPAGVGELEYAASGWIQLSGSEVSSFTRVADVLTLVRGQYNTTARSHNISTTVQQCYQKNETVDLIIQDLLTNFSGISPSFINSAEWAAEVIQNPSISGFLNGIITTPTDVNRVLKELSEAKPNYTYWDEINQAVRFEALKEPPLTANLIDMDQEIVKDSFKTKDLPKMRASTIYYTFGQFDPTKALTDLDNYTQTVVRIDTDSINKYTSDQTKKVISRWIDSTDKTSAENAAQMLGRRFSDIPREIKFSMEAKDSRLLIGQTRAVNHRDIVDVTGLPVDTNYQIISSRESKNFDYVGVEFNFGQVLPGDNNIEVSTIKVSINELNLNLYDRYVLRFGVPGIAVDAVFIIESGVIVGSSSSGTDSIDTGSGWIAGSTILVTNNGHIVGRGGYGGGNSSPESEGGDGGDAINLSYDMELENFGTIGGGGGGGGINDDGTGVYRSAGGGAGYLVGGAGDSRSQSGGLEAGGSGVFSPNGSGGNGGDLGQDGQDGSGAFPGGLAGKAIDKNGFTLTETTTGDIRGAVS